MSRLTRTPFHKPSLHDIPRPVHPLSPPDTEDSLPLHVHPVSREASSSDMSMSFITKVDPMDQYQSVPVDAASTPKVFRRPSTLNYLHSGPARESRSVPRPATRWLIIMVPPAAVARNAQTSNLFLNPSNRSSNGILMPLLPSLSSQLTSIAREFAFPSTTGICIYLNISDSSLGNDFVLRVSDESWPILWANALGLEERQQQAPSAVGLGGLPIAGRVEFDLDLRKARWFESWVTACRRNSDAGISAAPSLRHRREDSRTTATHDQADESVIPDDVSVTIQQKVPIIRHIPRKLSLLDRVETQSHHSSFSRPASRNALLQPQNDETPRNVAHTLTPVDAELENDEEEEEPQTAIQRVEKKVQNWRASSNFAASPLATSTGQTALEPANMPNTLVINSPSEVIDVADEDGEHVLNLDDFTWSISSAGPSTGLIEPDSALFSDWRVPSVHLAERAEGSVCLTPTTATSWGAPDYDPLSPAMSIVLRLPSPDIAARHIEDAPLTPLTATSWGAPSEWPASPALSSCAPSIDLGARCLDSRPATPSTATSWGAPSEWPESPAILSRVATPDIGQMFFDEDSVVLPESVLTETWKYVWPYTQKKRTAGPNKGWSFVWPYFSAKVNDSSPSEASARADSYPYFNLYPAVYPNFDLYPAKPEAAGHVRSVDVSLEVSYPVFSIYPAVYPAFEIYPGHVVEPQEYTTKSIPVKLDATYPSFEIYTPVYPHFDIYPAKAAKIVASENPAGSASWTVTYQRPIVRLEYKYPTFNIYPAVYPYNLKEIYPAVKAEDSSCEVSVKHALDYPYFDIYPAVYPHFNLYPSQAAELQRSVELDLSDSTPSGVVNAVIVHEFSKTTNPRAPVIVRLAPSYPTLEIYSPVYPNLYIYPPVAISEVEKVVDVRCEVRYPNFDIYPAVYPFFDIYRCGTASDCGGWREPQSVRLEAKYPATIIYKSVYPYFDIYSSGCPTKADLQEREILIRLPAAYPAIEIYTPVYPYFDIYNAGAVLNVTPISSAPSVSLDAKYPAFDLYPAVYPHFQIYPSLEPVIAPLAPRRMKKTHRELHDMVMSQLPHSRESGVSTSSTSSSASYLSLRDCRPRRSHKELHDMVFPPEPTSATSKYSTPSPSPKVSPNGYQPYLGLPVRPSQIRRTVSLNRATRTPSERENVLARNGSLKKLTPVEETQARVGSVHRPGHSRDSSESHEGFSLRRKPRRDSIVLERARHWGTAVPTAEPVLSNQTTLEETIDFPMPPLPNKLPTDLNRPIAKLDRSKFPFH